MSDLQIPCYPENAPTQGTLRFRPGGSVGLSFKDPRIPNYLCFTAEEENSEVSIRYGGSHAPSVSLEYSPDGVSWTPCVITDDSLSTSVSLSRIGDKVYFRCGSSSDNTEFGSSYSYHYFNMHGKIAASGNINSLLSRDFESITSLSSYCYLNLFRDCSSLTQAPELPATTLADSCYLSMFLRCTSLTVTPKISATTLADSCCKLMFSRCTSLTQAPSILLATTLAPNCYCYMFSYCSSLTQAPELPATTLDERCYYCMFEECKSLNKVSVGFTIWDTGIYATDFWLQRVSSSGTFACPANLWDLRGYSYIPEGWEKVNYEPAEPEPGEIPNYLCFTAEQANSTVGMTAYGSAPSVSLEYSTNGTSWAPFVVGETTITLQSVGDKAYLRCGNDTGNTSFGGSIGNYHTFDTSGRIAASGNINSLLSRNFEGITALNDYCYEGLFIGSSSLTKAPELPATTLAKYCYAGMFLSCSNLMEAPELPATTLAEGCYMDMFGGCQKLTNITVSFTAWDTATDATTGWTFSVAPSGTFTCPSVLEDKRGENYIPEGWTKVAKV